MSLKGKTYLVTGLLTESSIAFAVARQLQELEAEVVVTSFGKAMRVARRTVGRLPRPVDVLSLDVTRPEDFEALTRELSGRWGALDGALHSVAFAPESCLGEHFLHSDWDEVSTALHVSAFSLKALAEAVAPLMSSRGGSIVALDFDARLAWPGYNWMGVAKAALESTGRYLARELGPSGIRVNLVSAGPLSTMAARGVPQLDLYERIWKARAPLGWDATDCEPVARSCVALLSDWLPATTGEIVHVDGGAHVIGTVPSEGG